MHTGYPNTYVNRCDHSCFLKESAESAGLKGVGRAIQSCGVCSQKLLFIHLYYILHNVAYIIVLYLCLPIFVQLVVLFLGCISVSIPSVNCSGTVCNAESNQSQYLVYLFTVYLWYCHPNFPYLDFPEVTSVFFPVENVLLVVFPYPN